MYFKPEQFTLNPDTNTYVAEASDLGWRAGEMRVSFMIGNARFYFHNTEYDASGEDVAGVRYMPTAETLIRIPSLAGRQVLIIND